MEKGWNYEYLVARKQQLEEKLEKTTDAKKQKQIKEDIETCNYLTLMLLFFEGETLYEKVTMEYFVKEMYDQQFSYPISSNDLKEIEKIALSFSQLPKLKINQNNLHLSSNEAIEIVGDFIKDKFGDTHYKLFKKVFVNNRGYILFDKESELSSVTYLDGEIFVRITKEEGMKMLASIAHEAGHIYRIENSKHKIVTNSYGEYESFFYEFNFLLWLRKNNIYSQEATTHFLQQFDTLEKVSYMRYLIRNYELNQIKEPSDFTETIHNLHVKKNLHIRKNQDLFTIYSTAMYMDLQTYFNSFMAVLHHIDDLEKYEQVIKNIKTGNDDSIKVKILNKNKGQYESYLKYRTILQNLYKGQSNDFPKRKIVKN